MYPHPYPHNGGSMAQPIQYLYNVNYQETDRDLSCLEIKALFDIELEGKVFITTQKKDPSISPFIKNRLDIIYDVASFEAIIEIVEKNRIIADVFNVVYLPLTENDAYLANRRYYCKEVGLRVTGFPNYANPDITFAVAFFNGHWYLGVLNQNNCVWKKHNNRPYSYSSSLNINLAKVLVNLAGNGDFSKKIIDPCCGVGTVLFEGFFSGYNISGRELNEKVSENARINLRHFNYPPKVETGDIRDIQEHYDASIVDLPYGISVETSKAYQMMIVKNALRISDKLVLVSSKDIETDLLKENISITQSCKVTKNMNRDFARYIWICN
jgi:predicted RNA methylase